MTSARVVLVVEKGDTPGRQFELPLNGYRAVGREADAGATTQFTKNGDQILEEDDVARVEEHLERRSVPTRADEERPGIGAFRRGRDILLEDTKISRTHAMFFLDEQGPSVVDLMSTNGTRVNGERVEEADLHDGDIVHLGRTRLVVRIR